MPKPLTLLLSGMVLAFLAVAAHAMGSRAGGEWTYYHFDGHAFVPGLSSDGAPSVAVKDGVRPVVVTGPAKVEAVTLPAGTGALAGVCYIQTSRGKLKSGPGHLPSSGTELTIREQDRVVATTKTDEQGYFVVTLPAGNYTIVIKDAVQAKVEPGKTSLVALRAGKRMVD